jgi:hypothetical protein
MRQILFGIIIGLSIFCSVFVVGLLRPMPDYDKTECIYYASYIWCKK